MKTGKYFGALLFLFICHMLSGCQNEMDKKGHKYSVAVFKVLRHPAIDAMEKSFVKYLKDDPEIGRDINFVYFDAGGETYEIGLISDKIVSSNFSLVYVLGTPCAIALKEKTKSIPIVLGGATDPVRTGLVKSWENPGGNITGTTDMPPFEKHIDVLERIMPDSERIGVIYSDNEPNSVAAVESLRKACGVRYQLIELPIKSPQDIALAINAVKSDIDILCLPTDNKVQSNLMNVLTSAKDVGIPCFNCDYESVSNGALFSVAVDYSDIGIVSAKMAKEILLKKRSLGEMPIRLLDNPKTYVNESTAHYYGIVLPDDIDGWADVIGKE